MKKTTESVRTEGDTGRYMYSWPAISAVFTLTLHSDSRPTPLHNMKGAKEKRGVISFTAITPLREPVKIQIETMNHVSKS